MTLNTPINFFKNFLGFIKAGRANCLQILICNEYRKNGTDTSKTAKHN